MKSDNHLFVFHASVETDLLRSRMPFGEHSSLLASHISYTFYLFCAAVLDVKHLIITQV